MDIVPHCTRTTLHSARVDDNGEFLHTRVRAPPPPSPPPATGAHAPAKCDSCAHTRRTLILYRNVTIWCREWCRCKVYMVLLCIGVRELECAGHDRARTMRIARACPYGRIRIDNQHARARSRARRYDRKCACVCVCVGWWLCVHAVAHECVFIWKGLLCPERAIGSLRYDYREIGKLMRLKGEIIL